MTTCASNVPAPARRSRTQTAELVARRLVLEHQRQRLALVRVQAKERERRRPPDLGGLRADREAAEHGGDGARLGRGGWGRRRGRDERILWGGGAGQGMAAPPWSES